LGSYDAGHSRHGCNPSDVEWVEDGRGAISNAHLNAKLIGIEIQGYANGWQNTFATCIARDLWLQVRRYLSSFQRHLDRLEQLRTRCLLVQFGGAAGTLASLGSDTDIGLRVRRALAEELDLYDPSITWHTARDGVAEIISFLALVGGTLGKLAMDLMIMSSNELSEVSEPFVLHRGASSTMPQKRNPISSEVILAASKILRANAGLCLDAMVTDFERASGPWHLEWVAVPESFVIAVGALSQADFALSGLVVNVDQMEKNLNSTRGLIVAEAVMMELAGHTGRQKAHDIVYEACKETIEGDEEINLFEVLLQKQEVTTAISREKLSRLCEPANYLGAAVEWWTTSSRSIDKRHRCSLHCLRN